MQKFYDNHNETKNLGYIMEIKGNSKHLSDSVDFERSKSFVYDQTFSNVGFSGKKLINMINHNAD